MMHKWMINVYIRDIVVVEWFSEWLLVKRETFAEKFQQMFPVLFCR